MSLAWAGLPESPAPETALLNERQVSELTGISIETLRFLWLTGQGPAYSEDHGRIRCKLSDIQRWRALRSAAHERMMRP